MLPCSGRTSYLRISFPGPGTLPSPMTSRKLIAVLAGLLALVATGCGSSGSTSTSMVPAGLTISAPGLQGGLPPWPPEYAHLAERLRQLGLPPGGKETFHTHALLHIYVNGLLAPLAANIGLYPAKGVESSLHTHDHTGIIHMESPYPFRYTLGDFFAVWGVRFGPAQLGGLSGAGGSGLHFYINGQPLSNPAAHVLRNRDNIAIGYGADGSFPHTPSTAVLSEVEGKGGRVLACGTATKGHPATSCLAAPAAKK